MVATTMVFLTRVVPEKNMDRWYSVSVQPTLLDPWAVICAWGSRRTNYLRIRVLPAETREAALIKADDVVVRKVRRGYLINCSSEMVAPSDDTFYGGTGPTGAKQTLSNGE